MAKGADAWFGGIIAVIPFNQTGLQDIVNVRLRDLGKTPKAYIASNGEGAASLAMCMSDGTNHRVLGCSAEDNQGRPDTKQLRLTTDCFGLIDPNGGGGGVPLEWLASFDSFIPGGVRVDISDAAIGTVLSMIFFGGDDLGVEVGTFTASAAASGTDVLTFGGAISSWSGLIGVRTPNNNTGNDAGMSIGLLSRNGSNSTGQCVHYSSEDNTPATEASYGTFDTEFLRICDPTNSADAWSISRTGASDTSVTFTKDENDFTGSHQFDFIAIDSPLGCIADLIDLPITDASAWEVTGVGFKTEAALFLPSANTIAERNATQTAVGASTALSTFWWSGYPIMLEGGNKYQDEADADPSNTFTSEDGGNLNAGRSNPSGSEATTINLGGVEGTHTRKFTSDGWIFEASEFFAAPATPARSMPYIAFEGSGAEEDYLLPTAEQVRRRRRNPLLRM